MMESRFLDRALALAVENVAAGGGPFGALIVRNGEVVATGVNRVTRENDPTSHAEVNAIRAASQKLKTFRLEGCELYSSCEPCPMCMGAIYWAGVTTVYYGADSDEAAVAGFDDRYIYDELRKKPQQRTVRCIQIPSPSNREPFDAWRLCDNKVIY
ncbi:tRNA-specific adenosine deaminase [Prosthecochloris sp. ZM]|uniref:nucleoside deaminase n=1 Tax=Prosthecochloris sp. ZM TaxID=2283143 RepID=UPI000DF8611A|nr:nucleoside deaminase [Prosthecochloris sp. ZM]RDD29928.1 tRNA-specific adenosine deaminase [Prosthecochloris sp. ZM]